MIKHDQRGRYMDANDTAKKKMPKRLQTYDKNRAVPSKMLIRRAKKKRILEVNFCENKIVKIQLVFIGFSGCEG